MNIMNYIPKNDLETGASYVCNARNFDVGIWNGESFDYTRKKFGEYFMDKEYHWDDGAPYGTAKPLYKI